MVFYYWSPSNLEKQFEAYKEAGFDGIEIRISEESPVSSLPTSRGILRVENIEEDARKISSIVKSVGIEVHSIMGGLLWKYPLTSPEKNVREKGIKVLEKGIKAASILGASALLVVPGVVTENVSYIEALERSKESLSRVVKLAEEMNVILAIENVGNRFLLSPLEMRDFVDSFNSDYVKAYFDVGNVLILRQGYPQDWIRILGKRIVKVHVKDYSERLRSVVHLFQGNINWIEVIKALKEIGYNDYLTAELTPYRLFPEKMLRDTASSLKLLTSIS